MFYDFITKYTDIFFDRKMRSFCNAKASHIFSTKNIGAENIGVIEILTFEILTTHELATSLVLNNLALEDIHRPEQLRGSHKFLFP